MKVKLFLVQLEAAAGDIDKNTDKVSSLLEKNAHENADLIVLPELWTIGWDCANFNRYSEELFDSKIYKFLKELAKKYNANIIGGSSILRKNGEKDRNTCIILDRQGNIINTYDKYHLFSHRGEAEGRYLQEGDGGVIAHTDIGNIGISICYDIRFPELFRLYAFNGADFIVNMAAWPKSFVDEYVTLSKARAIENQLYFVSACLTGKINESFFFSGNSFVADYKGRIIASAQEEEKVLSAVLDIDEMNNYRLQMPILKDTKSSYKLLEKK